MLILVVSGLAAALLRWWLARRPYSLWMSTLCLALGLLFGVLAWPSLHARIAGTLVLLLTLAWGTWEEKSKPGGLFRLLPILAGAALLALAGFAFGPLKVPLSQRFVDLGWGAALAGGIWIALMASAFAFAPATRHMGLGMSAIVAATFLIISGSRQLSPSSPLSAIAWSILGSVLGLTLASGGGVTQEIDNGARVTLGLWLGAASVAGALRDTALLVLVVPALLLGMPLVDATIRLFRRTAAGQPLLALGRTRLSAYQAWEQQGVDRPTIATLFYLATAFLCLLAILLVVLIRVHFVWKLLILIACLLGLFVGLYALATLLAHPGRPQQAVGEVLGVRLAGMTRAETLEAIARFIKEGTPHQIITSDAASLVRAQEDAEFQAAMREAALVTPDGAGVVLAARLLGHPVPERVCGVDLVEDLCGLAAREGHSVCLLGGTPGVADEAATALSRRCPGLQVKGTHHGYFSAQDEPGLVEQIAAAKPDILFVALGSPRQEKWIRQHMTALQVPVCIGVGGTFDVLAGHIPRAPAWMRTVGLEWLYRTARDLRRLPRLTALWQFLLLTARAAGRKAFRTKPPPPQ